MVQGRQSAALCAKAVKNVAKSKSNFQRKEWELVRERAMFKMKFVGKRAK